MSLHAPERNPVAPARERGVVSVVVAFLLVAGVIFILAQTTGIVGTRSIDTSQQLNSTAALMVAESGLQRAQAIVGRAGNSGNMSAADCTGVGTGGPFTLERGSFSYSSAVVDPPACAPGSCNTCAVEVTGTVGSASRTLRQTYNIGVSNGTAGRGQTVTMVLKNIHDVPAMALFNMAWQRQSSGGGGNADATICANGATGCGMQWNVESSSGNPSIGGMGVSVDIPPLTNSKVVVQNISASRDYVEVGGLFPSLPAMSTPTIAGSYWDDKHNTRRTAVNSGTDGAVTNGVYKGASGACTTPQTIYPGTGPGSFQADTCTNWCSSADTLIFGLSGRSTTAADQLTAVTFNTTGTAPQNLALTKLVHFPNLDGSTPNASGKAYSEIWYAYNRDYNLPLTGLGATSYPVQLSGTVGATANATTILSGSSTMTITAGSFNDANAKICVGDDLTRNGNPNRFQAGTTVTGVPGTDTCSNAAGTYTFSPATTGGDMNSPSVLATSKKFIVKEIVGTVTLSSPLQLSGVSAFTPTAVVTPNTSVVYQLGTTAPSGQPRSLQIYTQGTSGTTISLPSGTAPVVAGTIVSVYSGNGRFAPQTTVLATPAPTSTSFTVSQAPSTPITGAAICGGTCALFNSPSTATSITTFTVVESAGTTQWSGGFMCLRGVDGANIRPVTTTTLTTGRWQEVVD